MDWFVSLLVIAGFALLVGAISLWRRGVRQKALLMAACALIAWGNAAIWLLPTSDGRSLVAGEGGGEGGGGS